MENRERKCCRGSYKREEERGKLEEGDSIFQAKCKHDYNSDNAENDPNV